MWPYSALHLFNIRLDYEIKECLYLFLLHSGTLYVLPGGTMVSITNYIILHVLVSGSPTVSLRTLKGLNSFSSSCTEMPL